MSATNEANRSTVGSPKGALFCPECAHESSVDGTWTVKAASNSIAYCCPNCDVELLRRRLDR